MQLKKLAAFLLVQLSILSLFAQKDLPEDYIGKDFYASRREAARALMPEGSVMVLFAAPTRNFSNDVDYLYHQNPDLYYFTGYKEPHAVLFLFKDEQTDANGNKYREAFFVQKRNAQMEQWTGRRLGPEGVKERLGINTVFNGDDFKDFPIQLTAFNKVIMPTLPEGIGNNMRDNADLYDLVAQFNAKLPMDGGVANVKIDNALFREITGRLREVKTPEELDLIRKAVEISCMAHNEAMRSVRADMSELEIQGLQEFVHKKYGAEGVGYGSIVGSGENGCILHYMENTRTRIGNDMLLMDVGAEYHGYTADVTRTIPANGKFGKEEKQIYQLVYDAQEAAFKILKDGAKFSDASKAARKVIADGLMKLGIISKEDEVGKYYPHGLGHHIGLDVHDKGFSQTLKKDMVWTVEPGIYIAPNSPCDKKWWGIAVRIEDDVLITQNGYELLSRFSPRSVEDIEKMMKDRSVLGSYRLPALESSKKKPL